MTTPLAIHVIGSFALEGLTVLPDDTSWQVHLDPFLSLDQPDSLWALEGMVLVSDLDVSIPVPLSAKALLVLVSHQEVPDSLLEATGAWAWMPFTATVAEWRRCVGIASRTLEARQRKAIPAASLSASASRSLLDLLVRDTPLAVIQWDPDFRVTDWNPGAERIFGYSREEALGRFAVGLTYPESRRSVFMHNMGTFWSESCTRHAINENTTRNHTTVVCEWFTTPLFDEAGRPLGAASLCLDITARVQVEKRLRRAEEEFRSIFDNAQEGIFRTSIEGRFLLMNQALARLHGFDSPEELVRSWGDAAATVYVDPSQREVLRQRLEQQGLVKDFEFEARRKDGSTTWMLVQARLVHRGDGSAPCFEGMILDIGPRKDAERALRLSEQRYKQVVEGSGEGIGILDATGTWVMANSAAERIFGVAEGMLVHRSLRAFLDYEACARILKALAEGDEDTPSCFEMAISRPGGERRWLMVTATRQPLSDRPETGTFWVFRDITEFQRTLEALAESEARLRAVVSSAPVILFSLDQNGRMNMVQGRYLSELGIAAEELVGRSLPEIQTWFPWFPEQLDAWDSTPKRPLQVQIRDRHFEVHRSRIPEGVPSSVHTIIALTDITDRQAAQEAAWSTEKFESLARMAGGIAHDFNNLIQALSGHLELMRTQPAAQGLQRNLDAMGSALDRAARLTEQLVHYAGSAHYDLRPLNLNAFLNEIQSLLARIRITMPSLRMHLEASESIIQADARQLQQVLIQVVTNAVEAIQGEGHIDITTTLLEVQDTLALRDVRGQLIPTGSYIRLTVQDSGCGIPAEDLPRIFDPFYSTKFTGRGLGLTAIQGILQAHQAWVVVTSAPQQGTRFDILFPAHVAPAMDHPEAASLTPTPDATPTARTVLVVDDEYDVRKTTCDMLRLLGYRVLEAKDGLDAVEQYTAGKDHIHGVVLDLTMPRMDGREALRQLRHLDPSARIIIASGYSLDGVMESFATHPPDGFLHKPYRFNELGSMLERVLAR